MRSLKEIEEEALQLTDDEKIQLAEGLMASVKMDPEIEKAWIAEAERRWEEIKERRAETYDADEVLAEMRKL